MTTRNLRRGLFCGLGAAALSLVLWDGASGAAADEVGNAFETIPPNEAEEIDELSKLATKLQHRRLKDPDQEDILRGVHPKSHGCVRAQFSVDEDIDASYRVGLFATPGKTYEAWIRYSNADVLRADDLKAADPKDPTTRKNGSRGMAIKVLDVEGEMLSEDAGRANQDFLMINTAQFAFANVRDYLRLNRIMDLPVKSTIQSPTGDNIDGFFIPLKLADLIPSVPEDGCKTPQDGDPLEVADRQFMERFGGIFEGFGEVDLANTCKTFNVIQQEILDRTVRNPLHVQYFGAAPFGFGPEQAMKFSAVPCTPQPGAEEDFDKSKFVADNPSRNYLHEALTETMKGEDDVCFDFKIQVRGADELEEQHVEDATTTWPGEETRYERVARITIPAPQDPQAEDVMKQCEAMAFSPWHSLVAHRPLGGINRVRQQVYIESAKHREAQGYH